MSTQPAPDCRCVLLADDARPARLIVCERTGRWAVALRRELAGSGVRVHESRSIAECWQGLAESPAGFAVVELTGGNLASVAIPGTQYSMWLFGHFGLSAGLAWA